MNNRKEIDERNKVFFIDHLKISKEEFLDKMRQAGKPKNGFGEGRWSNENPTAGRCGSVVNALRLSGKVPDGYVACGQNDKDGSHFYFINPNTGEVIDPTCYQMNDEYEYGKYHKKFYPQVGKNVLDIMEVLNLKIDETKFIKKKDSRGTLIVSKMK